MVSRLCRVGSESPTHIHRIRGTTPRPELSSDGGAQLLHGTGPMLARTLCKLRMNMGRERVLAVMDDPKGASVSSRRSLPPRNAMKTISWNRKAVEQAREQGVDDPREATCPGRSLPYGSSLATNASAGS